MGGRAISTDGADLTPRFLDVLKIRAFAAVYFAEVQSVLGDQLARVALSVLVFERTDSAAATALTYAATFLPAVLGGVLLSGVGERFSPRLIMVGCDLVRAGLFAAMAIPGLPIAATVALLVVAVFLGPAFSSSEVSYLAAVLERERFRVGTGLRMITSQISQVAGFALGGIVVAQLDPRGALLVDAATYALSAVVIAAALRRSSEPSTSGERAEDTEPPIGRRAVRSLWGDRRLRTLVGLCWLAGFFVVPEGLAVPFGDQIGASTTRTGLLFASIPFGGAIGAILLIRWVKPRNRERTARWMALAVGLPLIPSVLEPHWLPVIALWTVSGAFAAYQVEVTTLIAQAIPDRDRPRLLSIVSAGLIGAQGVGLGVFGGVAELTGAATAIGLAGATGAVAAAALCATARGTFPRVKARPAPAHAAPNTGRRKAATPYPEVGPAVSVKANGFAHNGAESGDGGLPITPTEGTTTARHRAGRAEKRA
jgi:predicted MFS family arabinose efflux permease